MQELNFFTEYEKDKSIKIGICPLVGKISSKISSHKAAWAYTLYNQLLNAGYINSKVITSDKLEWDDFDVILIYHGMEFKGTFNIFGGANDDLYYQLSRLFTNTRKYSLHHNMPDVGNLIEKRLKTGTKLFQTLKDSISNASEICEGIARIDYIEKTNNLCFGDSHSFSAYKPGYMCDRHDGLTLYGALKRGLNTYIHPWIKNLTIYLGNIDIRHHLMRQENPLDSIKNLLHKYENELINSNIKNIEIVHALPIEHESRVLPKTGYYKGTPFIGTWQERTNLVKYFNKGIDEICKRNDWSIYKHPEVYFNIDGELDFKVMEKPKSVHISREYYRWDMEKNKPNDRLNTKIKSLF